MLGVPSSISGVLSLSTAFLLQAIASFLKVLLSANTTKPLMLISEVAPTWCVSSAQIELESIVGTKPPSVFNSERLCNCTVPPKPSSGSGGEPFNAGEIVGLTVAALGLLGLVALIVFAGIRRNRYVHFYGICATFV